MYLWPIGLAGRISLVVLAAVCAVFLASSFIYRQAQITQVSVVRLSLLAEELSSDLETLQSVPAARRAYLVGQLSTPNLRLSIRSRGQGYVSAPERCLARGLTSLEPAEAMFQNARVCIADLGSKSVGIRGLIPIDNSQDLAFEMPHVLVMTSTYSAVTVVAITAIAICGVAAILIQALSTPLKALSTVADHMGKNDASARAVVKESGPLEVRGLAQAINAMQTRIQKLIEDKTAILAAVSHDLRTPLARLRLRADFLEDDDARQAIIEDIDEMESMINGVLAYLAGEHDPEEARPVDLVAILGTLLDMHADQGRITSYTGPERCLMVLRPIATKRIFANLIQNACAYGGKADVTLQETDAAVVVSVTDDGPGVPERDLSRIADPFFRVDSSRSRQTGGTGLGLAIVKREVRRADGRLFFSNLVPSGLEARVTFPRHK